MISLKDDGMSKIMNKCLVYSSKLTGNQFLYNEFKVVVELIQDGFNKSEIYKKVVDENLFEYRSTKSITKRLGAVLERVKALDDYLLDCVIKKTNEVGRLVNLYAIMKYDLLFFEFMEEVILDRKLSYQEELSKTDITRFFEIKSEQSELVAGFKETTLKRLRLSYIEILLGSGCVIKTEKSMKLAPPMAISSIRGHLEKIGDSRYLKAMLG